MESIELIGYPIKTTNSTVFKCSFITFATQIGIIDVKVNCIIDNYKYAKYIDYCHLCKIFIVKSRTNWILKDFITADQIFNPLTYEDCLRLSDILKLCNINFKKIDENFLPLIQEITRDFSDHRPSSFIQDRIERLVL
jgi:hypothetical protein